MSPTTQWAPRQRTSKPPAGPPKPEDARTSVTAARRAESIEAPVQFVVDVHHGRRRPLLVVAGELDIASAPLLIAMLDHLQTGRGPVRVEVDLHRVTFADSHGLQPLLDRPVTLRALSPAVERVLQLLARQGGLARPVSSGTARAVPARLSAGPPRTQRRGDAVPGRSRQHDHAGHRAARWPATQSGWAS